MNISSDELSISPKLIYQEATQAGFVVSILDTYTLKLEKNQHTFFVRGSRTSLQSSVGFTITEQKELTKIALRQAGIPTSNWITITKPEEINLIEQLTFPVVIKANQGSHGTHVHVGIRNMQEASECISHMLPMLDKEDEHYIVVEEMLQGKETRILVVDGEFISACYRKPAHVVGDGVHTIKELIDIKNQHPWRGEGHSAPLSYIVINEALKKILSTQDLTLDATPSPGLEVLLRKTSNLSQGGEPHDLTASVCAENKVLFEKIAQVCDVQAIAGIDVMCQDLSIPLEQQAHAGIIEVNASPGIRMHHFPLSGTPVNVASLIIKSLEKRML